jgi:hypothetical protein
LINQILQLVPHCLISNITCIKCFQQYISSNANNDPSSPSLVAFYHIKFFVEIFNFVIIMHFSIDHLEAHHTIARS